MAGDLNKAQERAEAGMSTTEEIIRHIRAAIDGLDDRQWPLNEARLAVALRDKLVKALTVANDLHDFQRRA